MQVEQVNGREVRSVRDLQALASGLKPGSAVSIIGRTSEGEQTIINYRLRS
jgi:PDZ domain-containing secreted protein